MRPRIRVKPILTVLRTRAQGGKPFLLLPLAAVVAMAALLPLAIGQTASVPARARPQAPPQIQSEQPLMHGDCQACHVSHGLVVRAKALPQVPHEIDENWTNCTFCHAPGRLAPVPSTHYETPSTACLSCHKQSSLRAPSLARETLADPSRAVLPASHSSRSEFSCPLCHKPKP